MSSFDKPLRRLLPSHQIRAFSSSSPSRSSWWPWTSASSASSSVANLSSSSGSQLSLNAHLVQEMAAKKPKPVMQVDRIDHSQVHSAGTIHHETFVIPNHSLDAANESDLSSIVDSFICHPSESSWLIGQFQDALTDLHDQMGLPWWATIVALTFTVRTILLPLNLSLVRNSARLNSIRPELETLNAKLRTEEGIDDQQRHEAAERVLQLFRENKCSPFRNILPPIVMTPIFLAIFMAWERTIVFTPSCQQGGMLWFENLAAVDVTFVLPVLSALTWIWTFRLGADRARSANVAEFERVCSYMSLAMIPVTQTLPQGVFVYWLSSNLYSMLFMFMTRRRFIRKLLGIPPVAIAPKKYHWE